MAEEPLARTILPLVTGSDWRRPTPYQIRSMSRVFGVMRGIAGFAVLGLAGLLVQSSWKPGVVFLILFVWVYNSLGLLAFYRGSDLTLLIAFAVAAARAVCGVLVVPRTVGRPAAGALVARYRAPHNVHAA